MQQLCWILDLQPPILQIFFKAHSLCLITAKTPGQDQPAFSTSARKVGGRGERENLENTSHHA